MQTVVQQETIKVNKQISWLRSEPEHTSASQERLYIDSIRYGILCIVGAISSHFSKF